ncbi:ATP phosphoribosyltransferase catalytic subunit HisG, partial [Sinorhizobium medicae]
MTVTIALPSKGRMKDESSAIFERAGMRITAVGNDRSYRGRVEGV